MWLRKDTLSWKVQTRIGCNVCLHRRFMDNLYCLLCYLFYGILFEVEHLSAQTTPQWSLSGPVVFGWTECGHVNNASRRIIGSSHDPMLTATFLSPALITVSAVVIVASHPLSTFRRNVGAIQQQQERRIAENAACCLRSSPSSSCHPPATQRPQATSSRILPDDAHKH